MRVVSVRAAEHVDPRVIDSVVQTFASCHPLAVVMHWCAGQLPPVQVAEIVTQDEYTHDVLLPFAASFLSFDTT